MGKYLPLEFASMDVSSGLVYEETARLFKKSGLEFEDEDDFVKTMLSLGDGTIVFNHTQEEAEEIVKRIIKTATPILRGFGFTLKDFQDGKAKMETEILDVFLVPVFIDRWAKNKQCFKPDKSFADALLKTKNVCLSKTMLKHLPCQTFYIDLSDIKAFLPIEGMFVDVEDYDDHANISIILVTSKGMAFWTFWLGGEYDEQELLKFDFDVMSKEARDFDFNPVQKDMAKNYEWNTSRMVISFFALQMIAYLSSKEPDVNESEKTKHTYRPSKGGVVKNQFREVQLWEAGVRYGKSYRQKVKELGRELKIETEDEEKESKKRKSPSPHFRCAHWQRFWTGEGRKKCVVKWIEPIFVGNVKESKDAVIHLV